MATVKAPGSRLMARPSITKADASTMASMRRQVSGQQHPPPTQIHVSYDGEADRIKQDDASSVYSQNSLGKRSSSLMQLDLPSVQNDENLGLGLEQEFDRVVKAQKRGYLMRQNTKVVVASNRDDDGMKPAPLQPSSLQPAPLQPTPRQVSQQAWVTEPWNGKSRRRSLRAAGEVTSRKKSAIHGQVPPLPGQASVVNDGLGAVNEDAVLDDEAAEFDEKAERGCLFVKVMGAKDLDLPLAQNEQSYFALTLDNGLHCVTTSWLQLGRTAAIDQEFELVVLDDLEFQLTLQMKLEPPKPQIPESPAKAPPSPTKKPGAFSRLFGSPRKHREAQVSRPVSPVKPQPPTTYDMVQGLVGQDGSFARAYVALSEHEKHSFGRPYTVDITCFNEWAMEEVPMTVGSSRSKKSVNTLQRRVPYHIGKLELQLLYIPKPKGTRDEDMPKSMNSAVRELREADSKTPNVFEGHLSQQGGDCPYWRRRLFKLVGSKLTAYHETTNQPRATINLAKASRLVDDKGALTRRETSTKGGGRRKSAFAEEEEGYMFVEEGFRIRFANGEVIDFYADSAVAKAEWMKALSEVVGKASSASQSKPWVEAIVKRQRSMAVKEGRNPNPRRPASRMPAAETGSPKKNSVKEQQPQEQCQQQEQVQNPQASHHPHQQQQEQQQQQQQQQQQLLSPPPLSRQQAAEVVEPSNLALASPSRPSPTNRHSGIPMPTSPTPSLTPSRPRTRSPEKAELSNSRFLPSPPSQQQQHQQQHQQGASRPPTHQPRPQTYAHARADSYQALSPTGARSQPASPVKNGKPAAAGAPPPPSPGGYISSRETRYQKARSIIGMQWR